MDDLLQQMIDAGLAPQRADILAQQMKRGQGLMATPGAQGMNVGGTYVAASPLEHLASAMSRIMGGRQVKGAEQGMNDIIGQQRAARMAYGQSLEQPQQIPAAPAPSVPPLLAKPQDAFTPPDFAPQAPQAPGLVAPKPQGMSPVLAALSGDPAIMAAAKAQVEAAQQAQEAGFKERGFSLQSRGLDQQAAAQAEAERSHRASEAVAAAELEIKRRGLDQDNWSAVADPTGGAYLYNKKTGERAALTPQGSFPGAGSGLRPQQFEADVQSLGKEMEPIAKAQPDLSRLQTAAQAGNVAGFGPLTGKLPNFAVSDEGVANRQAAGRLMAALILETSGKVASENEVNRLLEANGLGRNSTDEQVKLGVANLERMYQNAVALKKSKYNPKVVETYKDRGGFTQMPATAATAEDQQAKAWAEANPNDPRAAKILDSLKARGF